MEISLFEAMGFYEYLRVKDNEDTQFPLHLVIINTEDYSAGFCTCTADGKIETLRTKKLDGSGGCINDSDNAFRNKTQRQEGICKCIGGNIDNFNQKMKMFYQSERQMNGSFKDTAGIDLDCAGFDEIFKTAGSKIEKLLSEMDDLWEATKFDEDTVRFIIAGAGAAFYPIEFYIREQLTFDPFMPDERFVSSSYTDKPEVAANIGRLKYKEKNEAEHTVYVNLVKSDGTGIEKKKVLEYKELTPETIHYTEPLFISVDDKFEFEINGKTVHIGLPYVQEKTHLNGDVVVIGTALVNGKTIIKMQRYFAPSEVYDVPLE